MTNTFNRPLARAYADMAIQTMAYARSRKSNGYAANAGSKVRSARILWHLAITFENRPIEDEDARELGATKIDKGVYELRNGARIGPAVPDPRSQWAAIARYQAHLFDRWK